MHLVSSIPTLGGWDALLRLAMACGLGAAIGFEREIRDREAGIRTHLLVSLGSALFTIVSAFGFHEFLASGDNIVRMDPTRIAAQIVTGIGFLGAGAIIREGLSVRGLTTAATLWVVAAIGMACGAGYYWPAAAATVLTLLALWPLRLLAYRLIEQIKPEENRVTVELKEGEPLTRLLAARPQRASYRGDGRDRPARRPPRDPRRRRGAHCAPLRRRVRDRREVAPLRATVCSANPHKLAEFRALFPDWDLELLTGAEFPREDGARYVDNARLKAQFGRAVGPPERWTLADDSGIEVAALGGAPGVLTARWAEGRHVEKLLGALADEDDRRARYVCELVAISPEGDEATGTGVLRGEIGFAPAGDEGFGFDPVFVPRGETRTVAQLGDAWKAEHSHRALAARALRDELSREPGSSLSVGQCQSDRDTVGGDAT